MADPRKPSITPQPNGPYLVRHLDSLHTPDGPLETRPTMALCRCGGSGNKPFCDGTHARNGFSSAKHDERVADEREHYRGRDITIHDNRGICAHAGHCTDGLAAVFRLRQEPWIDPDGAPPEAIVETIHRCPSGALSYSIDGTEARERDGDPAVFVAPNGPYEVTGGPELAVGERAEGASTERFTLCRCGGSRNKPFCDGTHWHIGFEDGPK